MITESSCVKIKVTVPKIHEHEVLEALARAGAGKLGNYDYCSYRYPVTGRFRPLQGANPAIGSVGEIEEVEEICIECICEKNILEKVIDALKDAHPYEEPAIDIVPRIEIV